MRIALGKVGAVQGMRRVAMGSHDNLLEFPAGVPTTKIPTRSLKSTLTHDEPSMQVEIPQIHRTTDSQHAGSPKLLNNLFGGVSSNSGGSDFASRLLVNFNLDPIKPALAGQSRMRESRGAKYSNRTMRSGASKRRA